MTRYIVHTTADMTAERAAEVRKVLVDWLENSTSPVVVLSGCSVIEVNDEDKA